MQNWLTARLNTSPNAPALYADDACWTYHQLEQMARRYVTALAPHIRDGQRVALLLDNQPEAIFAIHALIGMGATLVPLNTRLTRDEIAYQLTRSDAALLLTSTAYAERVAGLDVPALHVESISADTVPDPRPFAPVDASAPLAIIFTSGTTGQPKGAVLTAGNFYSSAMSSAFHTGILPDDRWLCVLPLYHVGGLSIVIRSVLYGTSIDLHPRFDLERVRDALLRQPITMASLVPTMLHRLLESDERRWNPAFRLLLLGGAAATPELIERGIARGIPVVPTYGMSEAASQIATSTPELARRKPGSVGRPLFFTQVRIVDEAGREMPPGEYGEVVVSGLTVMQGYLNDDAATARAIQPDGLHTGDIGYLDADGDLWLVQRRSDLIVTGGENVYPAEVEAIIRQHPAVQDVVVVGVPDAEWGQRVAAAILLKNPAEAAELEAFCRQHLAGYKVPRRIRFVESLPMTSSGKIIRPRVVEMFT